MMDVDPWKPMIEERCHSSFKKPSGDQGLVKERTEVTGEVKADAAPSSGPLLFPLSTPQSHTQWVRPVKELCFWVLECDGSSEDVELILEWRMWG